MTKNTGPRTDNKRSTNKIMSLKEAVSRFVRDGDVVASAYQHTSNALIHEIVRQGYSDLTLVADSDSALTAPLIGLGRLKKMVYAYSWGANAGAHYVLRRAMEHNIPKKLELELYSNYGMALRFLAGSMNIPFLPTRSMLGSDICTFNKDIKIMDDPYESGKPVALVSALMPDVCLLHVHKADKLGNLQFFGHCGNTDIIPKASKYVIVTCEELITTAEIQRIPNQTIIPQYNVDAVIEAPFASHWMASNYYYHGDYPFAASTLEQWRTEDGFLKWCDRYIMNVEDWDGYCREVGYERLWKLFHTERKFQVYGEVR